MSDDPIDPGILSVRALPGANCSSIGSVVDMIFVGGVVGGALLVAVTAALRARPAGDGAEGGDAARGEPSPPAPLPGGEGGRDGLGAAGGGGGAEDGGGDAGAR